ncbi:hypothetical protein QE152_g27188 [Popillia japonica]|uniref:Uncharacterized protein n=1 Tax=Popillia japonica TaxID=7064 RepID=A0AAW1JW90_POPJA
MSKQIDTTQFKELMMLDKSLSAHLGRIEVQTADKALFANIPPDHRKCLTQSDIERIVKRISKYGILQPKRSNKMVQSVSNRSFTNVNIKSSRSITKRRGGNASRLKAVKSLSEGSIRIHKNTTRTIQKTQDKIVPYKNYLDAALDKLETQITKKIKKALTNYSDVPNKKSVNQNYCKTEIGTSPSPTMVTPEDIIDSEEVEIGSSDFEKRSSLSHTFWNKSSKSNYNSDVSSYNEGQLFLEENQVTEDPKAEDTCEFASIKQASLQEQNNGFVGDRNEQTTKLYHPVSSTSGNLKERHSSLYQRGPNITSNSYSGKNRRYSSNSLRDRGSSYQVLLQEIQHTTEVNQTTNNKSSDEKSPLQSLASPNIESLHSPETQQDDKPSWSRVPPDAQQDDKPNWNRFPPETQQGDKPSWSRVPPDAQQDDKPNWNSVPAETQQEDKRNGNRVAPPAIKQHECICGRKQRESRDKSIRFGYASLGTIEEENESGVDSNTALRLLHDEKDGSFESINANWKDSGSGYYKTRQDFYRRRNISKSVSDEYGRLASSSNTSIEHIPDPSKVNLYKVGNSSQRNDRFYFEDFLYDDCVRQECPKKRYYAQKLAKYNQERARRSLEKRPDKLYSYMLNVPSYRGSHRRERASKSNPIEISVATKVCATKVCAQL